MQEKVSPDDWRDGGTRMSKGRRLAAEVGDLLRRRRETVALAESCTGGLVSAAMTSVPGSSDYVWGGVTAYSAAAKQTMLELESSVLARHGTVSRETTEALAVAVRSISEATYGMAVTGWAGPDGGTEVDPVGTVYVALAAARGCETRRLCLDGHRMEIRERAVRAALEWLRDELLGEDRSGEETGR
jgi:PncC family amidohydrolase